MIQKIIWIVFFSFCLVQTYHPIIVHPRQKEIFFRRNKCTLHTKHTHTHVTEAASRKTSKGKKSQNQIIHVCVKRVGAFFSCLDQQHFAQQQRKKNKLPSGLSENIVKQFSLYSVLVSFFYKKKHSFNLMIHDP